MWHMCLCCVACLMDVLLAIAGGLGVPEPRTRGICAVLAVEQGKLFNALSAYLPPDVARS